MGRRREVLPEATGFERVAAAFCMAAFATVTLALVLLAGGWLARGLAPFVLLLLGLELAAGAVTVAAVALSIGPHRGPDSRPAWLAGGASLALVAVALVWLLPSSCLPADGSAHRAPVVHGARASSLASPLRAPGV